MAEKTPAQAAAHAAAGAAAGRRGAVHSACGSLGPALVRHGAFSEGPACHTVVPTGKRAQS